MGGSGGREARQTGRGQALGIVTVLYWNCLGVTWVGVPGDCLASMLSGKPSAPTLHMRSKLPKQWPVGHRPNPHHCIHHSQGLTAYRDHHFQPLLFIMLSLCYLFDSLEENFFTYSEKVSNGTIGGNLHWEIKPPPEMQSCVAVLHIEAYVLVKLGLCSDIPQTG